MITVNNVSKWYDSREVFEDISFSVGAGQKAALVGKNGIGKSTLLRLIAGVEQPDHGEIRLPINPCIGYLPQEVSLDGEMDILAYLKDTTGIATLEQQLSQLEDKLDNQKKIAQYGELQEMFLKKGGYEFESKSRAILNGLGLETIGFDRLVNELSGGQKSKLLLAAILITGADVLLLDEPTNNLDLPGILWLEEFIKSSTATTLIISHDRQFLDATVSRIFEIDESSRQIITHACGYTDYLAERARLLAHQKEQYALQQEEISRLNQRASTQKNWAQAGARQRGSSDNDKFIRGKAREGAGALAKRGKAIERRIDQIEVIEKPFERERLTFDLHPLHTPSIAAITLSEVQFSRPEQTFTIGPISLSIPFGERIALIGQNGAGKTTLLQLIRGNIIPTAGSVSLDPQLILGDLVQSHESLPLSQTALEYLMDVTKHKQSAHHLLKKSGIETEASQQPLRKLSPGMRARLILATFSFRKVNVLILDEPTNHLDVEALEALESALEDYPGTVIAVTHDRWFLEQLHPDRMMLVENGSLSPLNNFDEYIVRLTKTIRNAQRTLM